MDKYLVSLAILLFFAESAWLSYDINSTSKGNRASNSTKPLGKLEDFKSHVRMRPLDSLIWENTEKQQSLFAYDSLLTMAQSTADISLKDGSSISMNENTLLTIEPPLSADGQGPLRLRFKKGNISAIAGREPQSVSAGEYIIAADEKSQLNLRSDGENKLQIEAKSGEIKIIDSKTMQVAEVVEAGESAQVENHIISKEKAAKDLEWLTPVNGQKIYTHTGTHAVSFQWRGKVTSLDVNGKIIEVDAGIDNYQLNLPDGNYLVKLKVDNSSTFARGFYIWQAPKIHLITPVVRQRFRKENQISFLWTQADGVKNYQFQIATDHEFKNIVRDKKTSYLNEVVNDLPIGEYFWRVRGADDSGFEIPELYDSVFYILDKPLEAPKLKSPVIENGDSEFKFINWNEIFKFAVSLFMSTARADDQVSNLPYNYFAEFQWEKVEGATSYVVEVSLTSDFRELVTSRTVSRERFKWKNFKLRKYFWRVAGKDLSGEVGLFSDIAYADLTSIPTKPIRATTTPPVKPSLPRKEVKKVVAPVISPPPPPPKKLEKKNKVVEIKYDEPWNFSILGGTHYIFSNFQGGDFTASEHGMAFGDLEFIVAPPAHQFSFWKIESEIHLLSLKAMPASSYPFQDYLSTSTLRFSVIKNDAWGMMINQYLGFKRVDLENLGAQKLWGVGPMLQKVIAGDMTETRYRGGVVGGQVYGLDVSAMKSYYFSSFGHSQWSLSLEVRGDTGITLNRDLFYDLGAYVWLGFHW